MANVENINGVDKVSVDADNIHYYFPKARVSVNTLSTKISIRDLVDIENSRSMLFADVVDKRGEVTAEALVDDWANSGFFFETLTKGVLSVSNTSTALLTAGNTFTGVGELNSYPDVLVQVSTDQNGTLYCEFSNDGANWDTSLSFQYDTTQINPPHIFVKANRYFRVRFTNTSASPQTYLRLYTYYGAFNKLTAPINGTLSENYDAIVVRPTEYKYEVAMGKRQGRATVNKFGFNNDTDTATPEIVASFGGAFDPNTDIITTAQTFTIAYNNTTDGLGQTGALSLLFTYLDADFLEVQAVHVLGNTGSDITAFSGLGINRVVVISNGGAGWNVNDITVTATTDTTTQAQVPALTSVTQQCLYHSQIGCNVLLDYLKVTALKITGGGSSPEVAIRGYSWSRVTQTRYQVLLIDIDTANSNSIIVKPTQPFVLGGREVFYLEATTDTNNTRVSGRFSGITERVV